MCTQAHVFEEAGLATIVLTPMRDVAARMKVPRALYTKFPVGLSLGKPRDKDFQNEVWRAAFSLLDESMGPVIREFPIEVSSNGHTPLVCAIPPRHDSGIHPAVDEAQALKFAYDRALKKKQSNICRYADQGRASA